MLKNSINLLSIKKLKIIIYYNKYSNYYKMIVNIKEEFNKVVHSYNKSVLAFRIAKQTMNKKEIKKAHKMIIKAEIQLQEFKKLI